MKKIIAAVMALAMLASFSLAASATTVDQSVSTAETNFTFELKNDPTYTVTIPSDVTIDKDGVAVEFKAEDTANLDGKKVSVTIAGTSAYRNQMVLAGKTETGSNASIRYQIIKTDGTVIETTGGKDQVNGVEIASFTSDSTATVTVVPVMSGSSSIKTGVTYSGSMTYGISLVDAE